MEIARNQNFKLSFSKKSFDRKYEKINQKPLKNFDNTKVYIVKQKDLNDKTFIAKEYQYEQDDFLDNIWDEFNSIILTKDNDHPNIIKYYDVFLYENEEGTLQTLLIVMERGDSDLEEFISKEQEIQTQAKNTKQKENQLQEQYEEQINQYMKQTLNGLKYLKSKNIYHRDIKPQNLVLVDNIVKIIDFDAMKISSQQNTQTITGNPGTRYYIDPNIQYERALKDYDQNKYKYNVEKADIFSVGMSFLQIALRWKSQYLGFQFRPKVDYFYSKHDYQQFKQELYQITSKIQNQKLKLLIENMLVLDVNERWSLDQCLCQYKTQNNKINKFINNNIIDIEQFHQQIQGIVLDFKRWKNMLGDMTKIKLGQNNTLLQEIKRYNIGNNLNNLAIFIQHYGGIEQAQQINNFITQQSQLYGLYLTIDNGTLKNVNDEEKSDYFKILFSKLNNLQKLVGLSVVVRVSNQFGSNQAKILSQSIQSLKYLQWLSFYIDKYYNNMDRQGIKTIFESLPQNLYALIVQIYSVQPVPQELLNYIEEYIRKLPNLQQKVLQISEV